MRLILLNPCYTGSACANRIRTRPATRRKSPLQPIGPGESWSFTPAEDWIRIPIPAIIAQELFAKASLVDHEALATAQARTDLIQAESLLQDAFSTDVRPAIREWRASKGLPADPLQAFRESGYLERITAERSKRAGTSVSSYA